MALIQNIKNFFSQNKQPQSYMDRQKNEKLPFIMLMGTEKVYGKPQPNNYKALIDEYKSWAYACAWKNATSVAKAKICLYKTSYDNKKESEELVKIPQHPFLDLIRSVNPFSNTFELMCVTTINLELTGNAYWYMPKGVLGIPEMIWNIPSHWVKIVPSQHEFISGYVVTIPNRPTPIPFDESEIVHFKYPSPSDLFYGQGPLWAARLGVDLSNEMRTWGVNFFLNNAQPSGILTTDNSLTEAQYIRLRDQWNEKHKGSKNAGKMAFLENGLKYQQMGSNVRDARFEQVSGDIRDEILAVFGVPASKLGLEAHDNRATAEASDYTYQSETILPRLTLIKEKIQEKIIPIYDPRIIVEFEGTIAEDKEYKLKERQINLQSGFSSIDELRIEEGLDPYDLPQTKVPLIPFGLVPAGQEPEPAQEEKLGAGAGKEEKSLKSVDDEKWEHFAKVTRPQEKAMQQMMKRFYAQQHGDVMRKLNSIRSMTKDIFSFISFDMNESNKDLKNKARAHIYKAFRTGYEIAAKASNNPVNFDFFNIKFGQAVETRIGFFAEKTNQTTAKLLQDQLQEGLVQGESISDIAKRVDKVFNYSEDFRSIRTAQTEIIGAVNDGQLKSFIEFGVEKKKWITARDEKVRDSHQIDGQVVGVTATFTTKSGNHLLYPGDRSGGAEAKEVINCRCTLTAVID